MVIKTKKPPLYPHIKVRLVGEPSDHWHLLGKVRRALEKAKVPQRDIQHFTNSAMGCDHDQLLRYILAWVTVE